MDPKLKQYLSIVAGIIIAVAALGDVLTAVAFHHVVSAAGNSAGTAFLGAALAGMLALVAWLLIFLIITVAMAVGIGVIFLVVSNILTRKKAAAAGSPPSGNGGPGNAAGGKPDTQGPTAESTGKIAGGPASADRSGPDQDSSESKPAAASPAEPTSTPPGELGKRISSSDIRFLDVITCERFVYGEKPLPRPELDRPIEVGFKPNYREHDACDPSRAQAKFVVVSAGVPEAMEAFSRNPLRHRRVIARRLREDGTYAPNGELIGFTADMTAAATIKEVTLFGTMTLSPKE